MRQGIYSTEKFDVARRKKSSIGKYRNASGNSLNGTWIGTDNAEIHISDDGMTTTILDYDKNPPIPVTWLDPTNMTVGFPFGIRNGSVSPDGNTITWSFTAGDPNAVPGTWAWKRKVDSSTQPAKQNINTSPGSSAPPAPSSNVPPVGAASFVTGNTTDTSKTGMSSGAKVAIGVTIGVVLLIGTILGVRKAMHSTNK